MLNQAVILLLLAIGFTRFASAAELKAKTVEAFDRYVAATEARMAEEASSDDSFFWIDRLPSASREESYLKLRHGELDIRRLETRQNGKRIEIPDGLVHHWVGMIFIPNATLQQTLAVLQDYERHHITYAPYVRRSRLLGRQGDEFHVFLQFYRKAIIEAVLNVEFQVHYAELNASRVENSSYSTRIAEVEHPGPEEREKPVGEGRGLLWRLNTYARLEQRDGGVYYQIESIALTRRVPKALGWLINPFLDGIPRESLSLLLSATRKAVTVREISRSYAEPTPQDYRLLKRLPRQTHAESLLPANEPLD